MSGRGGESRARDAQDVVCQSSGSEKLISGQQAMTVHLCSRHCCGNSAGWCLRTQKYTVWAIDLLRFCHPHRLLLLALIIGFTTNYNSFTFLWYWLNSYTRCFYPSACCPSAVWAIWRHCGGPETLDNVVRKVFDFSAFHFYADFVSISIKRNTFATALPERSGSHTLSTEVTPVSLPAELCMQFFFFHLFLYGYYFSMRTPRTNWQKTWWRNKGVRHLTLDYEELFVTRLYIIYVTCIVSCFSAKTSETFKDV